MSKTYRNFILPKPAAPGIRELKASGYVGFEALERFLESMIDVAQAMTQSDDRETLRRNLYATIDSGVSSFAIDEQGYIYVVMWNFDRGEYLTVNSKNFDRFDYATLLRMSDILTKQN